MCSVCKPRMVLRRVFIEEGGGGVEFVCMCVCVCVCVGGAI